MHVDFYRDLIIDAVKKNGELLQSIAKQLEATTEAHRILRAKGYGQNGRMIDHTARQVPEKAQ
jgi:hypothetical protein